MDRVKSTTSESSSYHRCILCRGAGRGLSQLRVRAAALSPTPLGAGNLAPPAEVPSTVAEPRSAGTWLPSTTSGVPAVTPAPQHSEGLQRAAAAAVQGGCFAAPATGDPLTRHSPGSTVAAFATGSRVLHQVLQHQVLQLVGYVRQICL